MVEDALTTGACAHLMQKPHSHLIDYHLAKDDMKKSMTDHLVAKTPVFFLMLFFRLCENVLYGHIIPVMCTSALFYLPYHFVSHMISKQATKKSKSKK